MKKKWIVLLMSVMMLLFSTPVSAQQERVMVVPIEDEIELGLAAYLERSFDQAQSDKASLIVLEMNTLGGRIDAAQKIRQSIEECPIPIVTLVKNQAISAGAYIALASDQIAMMPGSTLGDAEVRIGGQKAEEKYISVWREEFAAMAELRGRDREIARSFVDSDIEIPGVVDKGKLLVLTANRAQELGFADYLADDRTDLLRQMGYADAEVYDSSITNGEHFARIVTSSVVAPILLTVGILCMLAELFAAGFGIAGITAIVCFGLYFGGHMVAGMASWLAVLLFIIGLILCFVEIIMPGFGIFGVSGIAAVIGSIFLTTPDFATALQYTVIVLVALIVAIPILAKVMKKRHFFDKLMVKKELNTEEGYISRKPDLGKYIGAEGKAFTVLRPAGTVILTDATRVDVVTKGDFIEQGEAVRVVGMDGTWLIVEKINYQPKEEV